MSEALVIEVKRLLPYPPLSFLNAQDVTALLACAEEAESELDLPNSFLLMLAEARVAAEPAPGDTEDTGEEG